MEAGFVFVCVGARSLVCLFLVCMFWFGFLCRGQEFRGVQSGLFRLGAGWKFRLLLAFCLRNLDHMIRIIKPFTYYIHTM